jgi:hypothetical protein
MLRLTDQQLKTVQDIAQPIQPFLRAAFLKEFAEQLGAAGQPPAHCDWEVWRAAVRARQAVLFRRSA